MDPHPSLTYDQAQRQMLSEMSPEQRIAHFQQDTAAQQSAVNDWHAMRFGGPPLP
ncbi:MAG TPA: hypothetical protein VGQ42_09740 [Candidatus Dormibacteraeota bacterium]|jgi:hypothetical protein|nr:hypothetical protein [Candidatus Dormibacteraeota bacterium]